MEGKIYELESCLFATQQINSLLEKKTDSQERYSKWPYLVISRMNKPGDEKNDLHKVAETLAKENDITKDIIIKNIDKTHPIGRTYKKGLQRRIVKFTSNSFEEKPFKKHKKNKTKKSLKTKRKTKQPINVKINLQPSLTKNCLWMLKYAKEKLDDVEEVKFIYVDMPGNLKVVLNLFPVHRSLCLISILSQTLVHCYRSCPVVMRITRIYMTIKAFTLLSYILA